MEFMENDIVSKFLSHQDFNPTLKASIDQVCDQYGFKPVAIISQRNIYQPDKAWRFRIQGSWQDRGAVLRIENLKLEIDEEDIRQAFRAQCVGRKVRPPETYLSQPFSQALGYGFSIEEIVHGQDLFDPAGEPQAAFAFSLFYRELRTAVTKPFWGPPTEDAKEYSIKQADKWFKLAMEVYPGHTNKIGSLAMRLRDRILDGLEGKALSFQHALLSQNPIRF